MDRRADFGRLREALGARRVLRRAGGGRSRLGSVAIVAVVASTAAGISYATELFRSEELNTVDARFSVRGTQAVPRDVVVVQVDDVTFGDLQERWPFRRSLHARVIDRLRRAGARTIAYDVQFTEPTMPREDNALILAIGRARGMVLSTTEVARGGRTAVLGGGRVLGEVHARAANTVIEPDPGGVLRRAPFQHDGLKGFAVAAAEQAQGRSISTGDTGKDERRFWIDYRGPPGTVPAVSFSRVLRGAFPDGLFRGRLVVVGASAPSLNDVHATSASGDALMSGPEIQASAIDTALRGFPLRQVPDALAAVLIVLMAALAPALSLRLSPLPVLGVALAGGGLYLLGAQLAFDAGLIVPVVYALMALGLATVGSLAEQHLVIAFERRRVRDVFARFVPEQVVDRVLASADDDLRLGGVLREATVLFSDLRGFTSFAEGLEPAQVIDVLNDYLGHMSDTIMDHGGTLVAYMGDGIMAVFG
ncbi:MAG: adenylate cyclase, partial [Thermoleophilaceae bacterium]|nr:adenylate cyclase [Thermoleophilaceae bacterium]